MTPIEENREKNMAPEREIGLGQEIRLTQPSLEIFLRDFICT